MRVRDLESMTGTLIDGEPGRREGVIDRAGWVKAGDTVFTIHLEGATPPREEDDALRLPSAVAALARLEAEAARAPLFAVLDAARDDRILELLRESVEEYRSLYDGHAGEAMAEVAPYLVRLPAGSRLLRALVLEGWGRRWGIYLTSRDPLKEVRRHWRRLLIVVSDETGERLYFRFYDPGALRLVLPTCQPRQIEDLVGEAEKLCLEARDGSMIELKATSPLHLHSEAR